MQGMKLQEMKIQYMHLQDMTYENRLRYITMCISFKF